MYEKKVIINEKLAMSSKVIHFGYELIALQQRQGSVVDGSSKVILHCIDVVDQCGNVVWCGLLKKLILYNFHLWLDACQKFFGKRNNYVIVHRYTFIYF